MEYCKWCRQDQIEHKGYCRICYVHETLNDFGYAGTFDNYERLVDSLFETSRMGYLTTHRAIAWHKVNV